MRYRLLGRTGLKVSELCLGTMTFGEEAGIGADRDECRRVFDAFAQAGGNFVDTANIYNVGTSERWLGEFLAGERERFVVASKYSLTTRPDDPNAGGNARKNLMESLHASLRRLGTEYIDLYWMHAWDSATPIDEVIRALDDAVAAGKVLYTGVSNAPAWWIARAQTLAEERDRTRFAALQVHYSLVERTCERELVPMAHELGIGITAWSPLAGGLLTAKYLKGGHGRMTTTNWGGLYKGARVESIVRGTLAIAERLGRPAAQVALNFLRQRPATAESPTVPIVGSRTAAQLDELLGCLAWELDAESLAELEHLTAPDLGYPQAMLNSPGMQQYIYGEVAGRIPGRGP
jgi:aryl-alcohol dehydrogenase-like predicted oxidoreductase